MASDASSDVKFDIGHVLFIDIVGYSRLLINQQTEQLETLRKVVRGTEQFRTAEAEGTLLRLPTGDGGALVFRNSPEAPLQCAIEILRALKDHPELRVRMGIHSGPVNQVADLNDQVNIAGAGVNIAQRVMDCGDAGHILLSKRVADDLSPYPKWNRYLHGLGGFEVKHGEKLGLVNFFTDEVGNPNPPGRGRGTGAPFTSPTPSRAIARPAFNRALVAVIALLIIGIGIGALLLWRQQANKSTANTSPVMTAAEAKSIAVLPFENLSEEKANAYFADGVQDEILTNLAKIADLKVISRSSVMQYRTGLTRNLREIGKQLGVVHLLEGSVQRAGAKVRVNAQLIDARTDAHLWAQTYDRDLADVFAIQSEIATDIAEQLRAKLAPEEKARLATKPTNNPDAYLIYLQANEQFRVAASKQDALNADKLYDQAIGLDPQFALAHARASILNSLMFFMGRQAERKTRAHVLADKALRISPNLGEAHLAQGLYFYRVDGNYPEALKELVIAGSALPNDPEILDASGYIYRRQGRWREALTAFRHAQELDPRRGHFDGLPDTLRMLREWGPASEACKSALQIEPQSFDGWLTLAYIEFGQSRNPAVAAETLERMPEILRKKPGAKLARWDFAMMARDFDAASQNAPDQPLEEFPVIEPKAFYQACIAFAQGNIELARHLLEGIRPLYETGVREHPEEPQFHSVLAKLYVLLGRKEEAIREAQRAVELCPESKDAVSGPIYTADLAFVCAQSGEVVRAVTLLSRLLTTPAGARGVTQAHLQLSWEWDPIRNDPRFQKLLDPPEPKTVYN